MISLSGIARGELADELARRHGDVDDAGLVEAEDDPALQGRGRVVEMHDGAAGAADRLEAALDQLGPGLGQHLDRDVVRDEVLLDELADKVKVGFRRGRKSDLDLLEAELDEELEHPPLAVGPIGSTSA